MRVRVRVTNPNPNPNPNLATARHREHVRVGGLPSRLVLAEGGGAGLCGGAPLRVERAVGDHGASVRLHRERNAVTLLVR